MNEENTIATPETEVTDYDNWDDIDLGDVADDDAVADEGDEAAPEAEAETEAEEAEQTEEPTADEPQTEEPAVPETFELKHLGETRQASREEVITLAQKGLNYDHVREERDSARAEVQRLGEYESFLKELADRDNISVNDFVDRLKARMMSDKEKISPEVALERVKMERERKAFNAQKAAADEERNKVEAENKRVRDTLLKFTKQYPDVNPKDITAEMWQGVREGGDLTAIYAAYENKSLKAQITELTRKLDAEKQNNKNKERATGSRQTAGKSAEIDALDRDWYDGT